MRCYYEVLEVERTADFDTIRRQYRKLALQWHPDKNPENAEEATQKFRAIQEAYQVLSDDQERAWYDGHRESILRGGYQASAEGGSGTGFSNGIIIDIMPYFSSSVYSDFSDTDSGFYTIYRNLFDRLRQQEETAVQEDWDLGARETATLPPWTTFGNSQTKDFSLLRDFYAYWTNFATRLSFSWVDQYRFSDAPNRRVRRLMEKENKRLRDAARKEYNDGVRQLVKFVQKRDKRYKDLLDEVKAAQETKAALDARRLQKQRAEQVAELIEKFEEQDWMKVNDSQNDVEELMDEELEEFYCIACEKAFKTDKQFMNHEKSKKHLKNVKAMRRQLQQDDALLDDALLDDGQDEDSLSLSDAEEFQECNDIPEKLDEVESSEEDNADAEGEEMEVKPDSNNTDEPLDRRESDDSDSAIDWEKQKQKRNKKQMKKLKQKQKASMTPALDRDSEEETESKPSSPVKDVGVSLDSPPPEQEAPKNTNQTKSKKSRRAKAKKGVEPEADASVRCNVCNQEFPTRNQLFKHINQTGHALAGGSNRK